MNHVLPGTLPHYSAPFIEGFVKCVVTIGCMEDVSRHDHRYSRQERFAGVGVEGQARIAKSRVAVVGCGALGSAQAELLARAGVGFLRLIDRDYVEISNLQRQLLYSESDAREALPKAVAAERRLREINSDIAVEAAVADLTPGNAADLLESVDLILDGTDNFETRYLINDWAVSHDTPWIYGAAVGSYGLKMAIVPGRTACLKCVYPEPPLGAQPISAPASGLPQSARAPPPTWERHRHSRQEGSY